jgi:hypothetical protein
MANKFAAWSELLNTYDVVWYIGTARAPVAESGLSCPACKAMVSILYDILGSLLKHFIIFPNSIFVYNADGH